MGDVAEGVLMLVELTFSERSIRQSTTYWPSWLRGVSRSVWITPLAGRP